MNMTESINQKNEFGINTGIKFDIKYKCTVYVDIDDTLRDTEKRIIEVLSYQFEPKSFKRGRDRYKRETINYGALFPHIKEEKITSAIWNTYAHRIFQCDEDWDGDYYGIQRYNSSCSFLEDLKRLNCEIILVSANPYKHWTMDWICHNEMADLIDGVLFTWDKDKLNGILIDDDPRILQRRIDIGKETIIFDKIYNRDLLYDYSRKNIVRCATHQEIIDYLKSSNFMGL